MASLTAFRTRRTKARLLGAVSLVLVASLAACSSTPDTSAEGGGESTYGTGSIALSWVKNYEFAGYYFADQEGYYTDAGFESVDLIAGGPDGANAWDLVLADNATIGLASFLASVAGSIQQDADLVVIGAQFVKSPVGFVSLPDNPITAVEDLPGKTIGVDATAKSTVEALLRVNGLPEDSVTFVTSVDGPGDLVSGKIDAGVGFLTNLPLQVEAAGLEPVILSFSDANYAQVGDAVIVKKSYLESNREEVKALMKAVIEGWNLALDDVDSVVDISLKYGAENDLDAELELASAAVQPSFMLTEDTVVDGIFTISPELAELAIRSLAAAGIDVTEEQLFDLSVLEEVYAENPDLIPGFTVPVD